MNAAQLASPVIALLVACGNLLLAAQAFALARSQRERLLPGVAALGVVLFAAAWFVSRLAPDALGHMAILSGAGGALAAWALALEALRELGPGSLRRRVGAASAGATALALGAGLALLPWVRERAWGVGALAVTARLGAACGVIALFLARLAQAGQGASPAARRHAVRAAAGVALAAALAGAGLLMHALHLGRLDAVDPLLGPVLAVEVALLAAVLERRLEVRLLLSRALAYSALGLAVAVAAVVGLRRAGYGVDLGQLAGSAALALMGTVLFLGAGELLGRGVEDLLFPGRARLARQLEGARSEAAALRLRLERLERLAVAGELAARVAHEIKNPLAALRGYAELLAEERGEGEGAQERRARAVRVIREESDRIDARVGELLRLGKPARPAPAGRAEVNGLVLGALAVLEGEPGAPEVRPALDPAAGAVRGDADALRGALLNLLRNAAEAGAGRPLEVRTLGQGGQVRVEVRDAGPGLDPSVAGRLFQPFVSSKAQGTGLGLVIVRSAVEEAGGRVSLRNREDGPGAVAVVELPRVE